MTIYHTERPTVLLTNDDGYDAPGIRTLYAALAQNYVVVVVAPDGEQSGVGHAFTYHEPLYYKKINDGYAPELYSVSGTPSDCVKFGISHLLHTRPSLVIAGLNRGENSGVASFYSGTVAAAREGAFWKIPSFAFSLCEKGEQFSQQYASLVPRIITHILDATKSCREIVFFNVNFPPCHPERAKGLAFTRQSMAFFNDSYEKKPAYPSLNTREGFFIVGEREEVELSEEYDTRALYNNWITVTPQTYDTTSQNGLFVLKNFEHQFSLKDTADEF
jgi:5'-nucleotidase